MCNQLVCEVCGGQGVGQRHFAPYHVTLCNQHFNELHCEYQKKVPRKVLVKYHHARVHVEMGKNMEKGLDKWMDAEHKYFLVTDKIVQGMIKAYKKKGKKTPRPLPSDEGELAEKP